MKVDVLSAILNPSGFVQLQTTNFSNVVDVQLLLDTLFRTFVEFKSHEQIENRFIMRKLKTKLKERSIKNTAVCNCHKVRQCSASRGLLAGRGALPHFGDALPFLKR